MNYQCPCCGYYTLNEPLNGNYDICSVCYWEDNRMQLDDLAYEGGANKVSFLQVRKNFVNFGACEEEMIKHVREAESDELHGLD